MSKPAITNPAPLWDLDMDELRAIAQTIKVGKFRIEVDLDDTNSREEDVRFVTLTRAGQQLAQVQIFRDETGAVKAQASAAARSADAAFRHLAVDLVEVLTGKMAAAAAALIAAQEAARMQAEAEARAAEDAEIESDLRNSLTYLGM